MSEKESGLYFLLVSVHGLIRGRDLELGRDADTGGQTLYVVELARALGEREDVARVDLVTRRIVDPAVSENYAQVEEALSDKVRIVRVDAGPEEYLPKEALWDHLDTFTDNLTRWLGEQPRRPDVVHSHYADAGYVGVRLAHLLGIPLVHTGHSLGRDKLRRLLDKGLERDTIDIHAEAEDEAEVEADVRERRHDLHPEEAARHLLACEPADQRIICQRSRRAPDAYREVLDGIGLDRLVGNLQSHANTIG